MKRIVLGILQLKLRMNTNREHPIRFIGCLHPLNLQLGICEIRKIRSY